MALLWCVVIGLELFFLLNDITLFQGTQSEHPETIGKQIAELHFSDSGVRWQNPRDVVWNESRPGQAMFEGQSVMTLSGAQARLVFDARGNSDANPANGEVLEIGEKSLIELRAPEAGKAQDGPLLLSLLRGNVKFKIGRKVLLSAGEFQIQLEPGAKFEAVQSETGLRLNLESGAASAIPIVGPGRDSANPGSSAIILSPGQAIEIPTRASGSSEARTVPVVRPISVVPTAATPSATPSPVPSLAPTPKVPVRLPPPKIRAPILRPRTAPAKPEGALRRIWNRLVPSAHAESPATPEWEIELQWDAVPEAKAYRVEISRTRSFRSRVTETTVSQPSWIWLYRPGMENSKGRVFYRVASVSADGTSGSFSEPRTIVIPPEILADAHAAVVKTPPLVNAPPKAEAKTPSAPPASATPTPPPAQAASVVAKPKSGTPSPLSTRWSIRPSVEFRSQSQTSDYALLRKAEPSGGFLHEGLRIERESERFLFALGLRASHYEKSGPPPGEVEAPLPKTRSFEGRVSLLAPYSRRATGWRRFFFYGASGFLEDRFVKAGSNRLALKRGFSLGPAAGLRGESASVAIALPLTGLLGSGEGTLAGPYGATIEAQKNWNLARLAPKSRLLLSVGAEASWHYWKAPPDSRVVEWALGFGPKVVFE